MMRVRACLFRTAAWCGFWLLLPPNARYPTSLLNATVVSGYFTLAFSFLRDIASAEQHDAVVQDIVALLTGSDDAAALRLNM